MVIGCCTVILHLPAAHSLKEKRQVVKSILARVRNEFNVSIAEVDSHNAWQEAVIGMVCVSTSRSHAHGLLESVVRFIEARRPDIPLVGYEIEML